MALYSTILQNNALSFFLVLPGFFIKHVKRHHGLKIITTHQKTRQAAISNLLEL